MYNTVEEANQKLKNTVVIKGDTPIWIICAENSSDGITLTYREMDNRNKKLINISDNSLDFKNLGSRLGYVNIPNHDIGSGDCIGLSVYSRRAPVRQSHSTQGLSDKNVFIDRTRELTKWGLGSFKYKFSNLEYRGLKETLKQNYPNLSEIRQMFQKNDLLYDIAFNRYLCVSKDFNGLWKLNYKGKEIGWTHDLEIFQIEKEFRYLDELFEECSIKVRG